MRIALVLGSGGARGFAHIGAVRALTERGHEVAAVAGTSVGALVGGMAAAGQLEEFASWVVGLDQRDVFRYVDPSFTGPGIMRAERVLAKISDLLGGALIEDLPVPYTAVATDVVARREVWFQRGPLDAAIRASIAIPTLITPVMLDRRILVDGGLLNPVPVAAVLGADADATVAVSLNGDRDHERSSPERATAPRRGGSDWMNWLRRGMFARLPVPTFRTEAATDHTTAGRASPLHTHDVLTLSLETVEALTTRHRLASMPPDVLVTVSADSCGTLEFHRAAELIDLGHRLTGEALDQAGW